MHLKRWITGLIALPFLIFLIYMGGAYFIVLVSAACLAALYEYNQIVFSRLSRNERIIFTIPALIAGMLMVIVSAGARADVVFLVMYADLLLIGFWALFRFGTDPDMPTNIARQITGIFYVAGSLSLLTMIRNSTDGMVWIFFLLGIIFAGDIGAFYVGSKWGKRKICPAVSPGKTVEGAIGGILSNIVFGSVVKAIFLPNLRWTESLLFFILVGVAGQVGDLFESLFKRAAGVKDSGVILPGHGGMLDRIDALLFAAPVAYLFKVIIFG